MTKTSIAFLDSGIGGLPYLSWVKERRPDIAVSYLADTANFPYGELSDKAVITAVVTAAEKIFETLDPDILAIVCNTASVTALDDVRKIAPCPVVGTVPAVKPAAKGNGPKPIGLLATQGTVNSPYVDRLIEAYASHREIIRVAAGDIVRFVEEQWLDEGDAGAVKTMKNGLGVLKDADIESLIIGCTHFLHVLDPIKEIMGEVRLVDSREGVGRRILDLFGKRDAEEAQSSFYVTELNGRVGRYRRFADLFSLEWAGAVL